MRRLQQTHFDVNLNVTLTSFQTSWVVYIFKSREENPQKPTQFKLPAPSIVFVCETLTVLDCFARNGNR